MQQKAKQHLAKARTFADDVEQAQSGDVTSETKVSSAEKQPSAKAKLTKIHTFADDVEQAQSGAVPQTNKDTATSTKQSSATPTTEKTATVHKPTTPQQHSAIQNRPAEVHSARDYLNTNTGIEPAPANKAATAPAAKAVPQPQSTPTQHQAPHTRTEKQKSLDAALSDSFADGQFTAHRNVSLTSLDSDEDLDTGTIIQDKKQTKFKLLPAIANNLRNLVKKLTARKKPKRKQVAAADTRRDVISTAAQQSYNVPQNDFTDFKQHHVPHKVGEPTPDAERVQIKPATDQDSTSWSHFVTEPETTDMPAAVESPVDSASIPDAPTVTEHRTEPDTTSDTSKAVDPVEISVEPVAHEIEDATSEPVVSAEPADMPAAVESPADRASIPDAPTVTEQLIEPDTTSDTSKAVDPVEISVEPVAHEIEDATSEPVVSAEPEADSATATKPAAEVETTPIPIPLDDTEVLQTVTPKSIPEEPEPEPEPVTTATQQAAPAQISQAPAESVSTGDTPADTTTSTNVQPTNAIPNTATVGKTYADPAPPALPAWRNYVSRFAVVLMLVGAIGLGVSTAYFWFGGQTNETSDRVVSVTSLIPTNIQIAIPLSDDRAALLEQFAEETDRATAITQLYPIYDINADPVVPVDLPDVLQTLAFRIPGNFERGITDITFGSSATNEPFIIMRVEEFDTAFAGMLSWEAVMSADLTPWFGPQVIETFDVNARTATQLRPAFFVDKVEANKNLRLLIDADSRERITYGFVTPQVILLTTTIDSFRTLQNIILNR